MAPSTVVGSDGHILRGKDIHVSNRTANDGHNLGRLDNEHAEALANPDAVHLHTRTNGGHNSLYEKRLAGTNLLDHPSRYKEVNDSYKEQC